MTNESYILEVGVKIFLTNADGKILVLKRAKPYPGTTYCKWDIPGGRIHAGENHLKALKREVKEETGLTLKVIQQVAGVQDILRVPGRHTIRITYIGICGKADTVILNPAEHSAYKWVTIPELHRMHHDTFLTPLLKKVSENIIALDK